ncbi:MAG: EamA family transporter [bacterium]
MKVEPYIILSLIAAGIYGIANPLMGVGQRLGLTTSSTIFSSSLGGFIVGLIYWWNHRDVPLPPPRACAVGIVVGAIWTIAMLLWTRALAPDMNSTASIVFLVVGTSPFISVIISSIMFREWDKVVLWKFFAGGALIAAGLYLITTCKKVPAS